MTIRPFSPLSGLDNLIFMPYVASLTVESVEDLANSAASQILQTLRSERPPYLLNSGYLSRPRSLPDLL